MKRFLTISLMLCAILAISHAQTKGDVNYDGVVNELDLELIRDIILDAHQPTTAEMAAADSNNDGVINSVDLQFAVNRFLAETDFEIILANKGEHWAIGTAHTILWNPSNSSAEKVKIELSTDSGTTWSPIIESTENDGNVRWIPKMQNVSEICLLKISTLHDFSIADQSDLTFSIVPNQTELKGDINFNCQIDTMDVEIIQDILLGVFEPTPEEFWIADIIVDGKINVQDIQAAVNWIIYEDWHPAIDIVSPNKATWQADEEFLIQWASQLISNTSEFVIGVSPDNGQTWTTVFDSTKNDGNEQWIPSADVSSNRCLLRVSSASCGMTGLSNVFKVQPPFTPTIRPVTACPVYSPSDEICIEIVVGSPDSLVYNLFGCFFNFEYNKNYLKFENGEIGDLLGKDVSNYFIDDPLKGILNVGISRKAGTGDIDDYGCVVRLNFVVNEDTPDNTEICFVIKDVSANDCFGEAVLLNPVPYCVTIRDCVECWPGDSNSDGIVNEQDILPIGLNWHLFGPLCQCRQDALFQWDSCCCQPWNPRTATCCDANGDGIIDEKDITKLAFFWQKKHKVVQPNTTPFKMEPGYIGCYIVPNSDPDDEECEAIVYMHEMNNLFGASFELSFKSSQSIDITSVENGGFLGDDIIFFANIDNESSKVAVGTTRKFGQDGVSGTGKIAKIKFKRSGNVSGNEAIALNLNRKFANNSFGTPFKLDTTTYVDSKNLTNENMLPSDFALHQNYPNPFNPTTQINYQLPKDSHVKVVILNSLGQEIKTMVDEEKNAGFHSFIWNGLNEWDEPVSSGVYIVFMSAGDFIQARKMVLLR